MIVVMNVVRAVEGRAEDFERAFLTRERLLNQAEGFRGFELLRRDKDAEYVVLTKWDEQGGVPQLGALRPLQAQPQPPRRGPARARQRAAGVRGAGRGGARVRRGRAAWRRSACARSASAPRRPRRQAGRGAQPVLGQHGRRSRRPPGRDRPDPLGGDVASGRRGCGACARLPLSHPSGPNLEQLATLNPGLVLSSPTWAAGTARCGGSGSRSPRRSRAASTATGADDQADRRADRQASSARRGLADRERGAPSRRHARDPQAPAGAGDPRHRARPVRVPGQLAGAATSSAAPAAGC